MPAKPTRSGPVVPKKPSFAATLGAVCIAMLGKGLGRSFRVQVNDQSGLISVPDPKPLIFALWHNRLALSMVVWTRYVKPYRNGSGLVALISASRDGAFLSEVLRRFDVQAVRGSSSRRGPQALRELTTWINKSFNVAITPDGPRGPRYCVQEGVISLARITGAPIIPVGINLQWKKLLKSWDGFQIPCPFSRCALTFGPPVYVPEDSDSPQREEKRLLLENVLRNLNQK